MNDIIFKCLLCVKQLVALSLVFRLYKILYFRTERKEKYAYMLSMMVCSRKCHVASILALVAPSNYVGCWIVQCMSQPLEYEIFFQVIG